MFPYNSPTDVRIEYETRVNEAIRRRQLEDSARWVKGPSVWTRLRAWLSTRRPTRIERRRPVDYRA